MVDDKLAHVGLRELVTGYWAAQAVSVAASLRLADLMGAGPRTSEDLASLTGTDHGSLFRLLRALTSVGVFHQSEDGRFELTPLGQYLRADCPGSLRDYAVFFGDERQWRAWGALAHSVRTGETGYQHAHGVGLYDYLAQAPEAAEVFDRAMAGSVAHTASAVATAYDFSGFERLVDVGGGDASLMAAVLHAHPSLRGVVVEQEGAAGRARTRLRQEGLDQRCEVVVGDFFDGVPAGGDAYLLSRVMHVFDDEAAVAILRNCRRRVPHHGVVLVVERVLPPANTPFFGMLGDLNMLALTGGVERTEAEYRVLLESAGLVFAGVVKTATDASVLEARPEGDKASLIAFSNTPANRGGSRTWLTRGSFRRPCGSTATCAVAWLWERGPQKSGSINSGRRRARWSLRWRPTPAPPTPSRR